MPSSYLCRSHHASDGLDEQPPLGLLLEQLPSTGCREAVVLGSAVEFRRLPFSGNEPPPFQPMKRRIERSSLDPEKISRTAPNTLADSVPMLRAPSQGPKDQHVERALQQVDGILISVLRRHRDGLADILVVT